MIESISLRNFKAFGVLEQLPLRPLTVFCGANSSGKSSVLQSLLLWKQTLESRTAGDVVLLNGRLAHLGSLLKVIYGHDPEGSVELTLTLDSGGSARLSTRHTYAVTLCLGDPAESGPLGNSIKVLRASLTTTTDAQEPQRIVIEEDGDNLYQISWEHPAPSAQTTEVRRSGNALAKIQFISLTPVSIEAANASDQEFLSQFQQSFDKLRESLLHCFNNTSYLGPLREEPARRYIYEDEARDIGVKGENAAYIYLVDRYKPIASPAYFIGSGDTFIQEASELSLSGGLSKWFSLMGVNDFSPEQTDEIIRLTLRSNSSATTRVNMADVGFGVSQVFPILLEGLRLPKGGTLILEQPEIHLHPKLELQLADFLISLALGGKRVIVETHSDHIVNRLVRRIVEDTSATLGGLASVYFFTPGPEGTKVETVRVDEDRGIVNWPNGFFDQGPSEQEKIIRAGLHKRIQQRAPK
jgi:predicted ATPase